MLYVSALKIEVGPSIPVGLVLKQDKVLLHQYAHPLVIVGHPFVLVEQPQTNSDRAITALNNSDLTIG